METHGLRSLETFRECLAAPSARRYFLRREDFFGTFAPAARASDNPIAIACLRLVTFLPDRPLRSVPCLRSCIARFTFCYAFFPYFVAICIAPFEYCVTIPTFASRAQFTKAGTFGPPRGNGSSGETRLLRGETP